MGQVCSRKCQWMMVKTRSFCCQQSEEFWITSGLIPAAPDQLQLLALLLCFLSYEFLVICFRVLRALARVAACFTVMNNCSVRISTLSALEQSKRKNNAFFIYTDFILFAMGIVFFFFFWEMHGLHKLNHIAGLSKWCNGLDRKIILSKSVYICVYIF